MTNGNWVLSGVGGGAVSCGSLGLCCALIRK